jgi:hypothetical protein
VALPYKERGTEARNTGVSMLSTLFTWLAVLTATGLGGMILSRGLLYLAPSGSRPNTYLAHAAPGSEGAVH